MAQDDRRNELWREHGETEPDWRGDEGFGGGWGNQVPRPHRAGGPGFGSRYDERADAGGDWYGPDTAYGGYRYGGPGLDAGNGWPRRTDFARARRAGAGQAYVIGTGGAFGTTARDEFAFRTGVAAQGDLGVRTAKVDAEHPVSHRAPHFSTNAFCATYSRSSSSSNTQPGRTTRT